MLNFGNKEFRNLQEQVLENAKNIEILKAKPQMRVSVVDELPEVGDPTVIYLVPSEDGESPNVYEEYVWLEDEERYELIGTTDIDLSNMVTTDTEQTITGSKTFTSPIIVGASGYDIKKDGSNMVIEADGNDVKVRGGLTPNSNATYSLGTNSLKWANLHLNNGLLLGNTTTAGQGQITFKNPDLTNQGNWYITSPDQNGISFMQDTQNTGVRISRGTMYPLSDAYFTLGSSSYRWKTLFLSHYVSWGSNVLIGKDSSNRFYVSDSNGATKIKVGVNETYFANHVEPDSNNTYDLGRTNVAWRDIYLSGKIKNAAGTTSVDPAKLVEKPDYNNPDVFAYGTLDNNGQDTIDISSEGVGVPADGLYMFTYNNCQCFLSLTSTMVQNASSAPIRCPCPMMYNGSAYPGILKIERSSDLLTLTVATAGVGNVQPSGFDWKLIKVM